jgi:aminoglycoside phosphotransferase (APT) family kinase protein
MGDVPVDRYEWKHLPESLLVAAVEKVAGGAPTATERLFVSYSNDVYEAETGIGPLIVRAHRGEAGHFEREGWAIQAAASAGCPVPEVLAMDDVEDDDITWSLSVQRKLPGVPLLGLPAEEHRIAVREAGECLARVHSVPTTGLGYLDGKGVAPDSTWSEFMKRHDAQELVDAAQAVGLDAGTVLAACDLVAGEVDLWTDVEPHLVHGDFSSKHVLVDDGHVSGIIDFEFAASNDAARDLAFWSYQEPATSTAVLLDGYRAVAGTDASLDRRVAVLRLLVSLDYISYHAPRGEVVGSFRDQIAERLPADLARLS